MPGTDTSAQRRATNGAIGKFLRLSAYLVLLLILSGWILRTENEARRELDDAVAHAAKVLGPSLWNLDRESPVPYLEFTVEHQGLESLIVTEDDGSEFLSLAGRGPTGLPERLFAAVGMAPLLRLNSAITHDGSRIGFIAVEARPGTANRHLLAVLVTTLVAGVIHLIFRLSEARRTLEKRVRERTGELRESEETLRALLDASMEIALLSDKEGTILDLNDIAAATLGGTKAEIAGRNFADFMPPELAQARLLKVEEAALTGSLVRFEDELGGRFFENSIYPVRDSSGSVTALAVYARDVTEQRRAVEALRASEARYRTFFENSCDPMFMLRDDRFIDCNAATLAAFGFENKEQLLDTHPAETSPEFQPSGKTSYEQARESIEITHSRGTHRFEWEHVRTDGKVIPFDIAMTAIPSQEGMLLLAVLRDISDRKQAERDREELEAQLRQAQKLEAVGTLAGGIAHDFNNILTPIVVSTELLLMDKSRSDDDRHYLDEILKASNRARDLVRQILSFSRRGEEERLPLKVGPVVKEAMKFLRASIPTTIEIRQELGTDATILANPVQLHQVLLNLCVNASHAMADSGGALTVSLDRTELSEEDVPLSSGLVPGNYLKLTVSDTGPGIEAVTMEKIFDPFFTTKPREEGTGLGLSVVHGIVASHGGGIHVESEAGQGAVFTVYLPLHEGAAFEEAPLEAPLPRGEEAILLVDDDKAVLEVCRRMLTYLGYRVEALSDPLEALELFRERPDGYDLLITDLTMPKMDGLELARSIRTLKPRVPCVLMTGYGPRIDREEAVRAGVVELLKKPLGFRETATILRRVLKEAGD
jgi:PAS domain S-box-containing protein